MRNWRRLLASALAIILVCGNVVLPWPRAFAATSEISFTAAANVSTVSEGDAFTITISATELQNMGGAVLNVPFDTNAFVCKSISSNDYAAYCMTQNSQTSDPYWAHIAGTISTVQEANQTGRITLQVLNTQSPLAAGYTIPAMQWFSIVFEAKPGAAPGNYALGVEAGATQTSASIAVLDAQNAPQDITVRSQSAAVSIAQPPISGTLTILGDARFNETLTLSLANAPADITSTIQWYRNGSVISGATGSNYVLAAADMGANISAKIQAAGYTGALSSANTIGPVARGNRAAPPMPSELVSDRTESQIVLQPIVGEGIRYGCSVQNDAATVTSWQESTVFTGLLQNTTYYLFAKYVQTATYHESAASAARAITTSKAAFRLTVQAGSTGGGVADYSVTGSGNVQEGSTILLTAMPDESSYFSGWQCSSPAVSFADAQSPETSFTMPASDVAVTAQFTQKHAVVIQASPKSTVYSGQSISIDPPSVQDSDACGNISAADLRITYALRPGGVPLAAAPKDAGIYDVAIAYAGDGTHLAAAADTTLTISQAAQAAPAAPTIVSATQDQIVYRTQSGLSYLLLPAADAVPGPSTAGWRAGSGQDGVWQNLQPGTAYRLYAYIPGSSNLAASGTSSGMLVTTLHEWDLRASVDGNAAAAIDFYAKSGYAAAPGAKTIVLKNTGTGALAGISVMLSGADMNRFTLDTTATKTSLASGESTSFTVQPKTGAGLGEYAASISIAATQNEAGETGAIAGHELAIAFHVTDKTIVTITGANDRVQAYNRQQHTILQEAVATSVPNGEINFPANELEYWYTGEGGYSSATPPVKAGAYTVTIKVPDGNAEYTGMASATLTILKATLNIWDLEVNEKAYDGGVAAVIQGGSLTGVYAGDTVSIAVGMPTAGTFASANAGSSISVATAPLSLTGADAGNYMLMQPVLAGNILPKKIKPAVTIASRAYDGSNVIGAAQISATFGTQVVAGDSVSIAYVGGHYADKHVGTNKAITLGAYVVAGNPYGNYAILPADAMYANITPKLVDVLISGNAIYTYNGQKNALAGSYLAMGSDIPNVQIQYNGTNAAPSTAGNYAIAAQINDANYLLNSVNGVTSMEIRQGNLSWQDVHLTIAAGNTGQQTVSLSAFSIAPPLGAAAPSGTYTLGTVVDTNGILDNAPALSGNNVLFRLKQSAQIGQTADIPVHYAPAAGTYLPITCHIQITVSDEGYTNTVLYAPTTVQLGTAIDFTNVKLRTVFESGRPTEEVGQESYDVATAYDQLRTGENSIGMFTVTLTHRSNPLRKASFQIQAMDVATGISVIPPTKLLYTWKVDTALLLEGGSVARIMQSGIAQPYVALDASMLDITAAKLDQLGVYPVAVSYLGQRKPAAFFIQVVQPPIGVTNTPSANRPGIVGLDNTSFATEVGGIAVPSSDVQLLIAAAEGQDLLDLQSLLRQHALFSGADAMYLQIQLVDAANGNVPVRPSRPLTVQLPYPAGMGAADSYLMIHKKADGTFATIPVTRAAGGLTFQATEFSGGAFALAYKPALPEPDESGSNGNNTGGNGNWGWLDDEEARLAQQRQDAFWNEIIRYVDSAQKGSTIRASAGNYDQFPAALMLALRNADVTLVISWNGGSDITITSAKAPKPESNREFYPLTYLHGLFGEGVQQNTGTGSTLNSSGTTSGSGQGSGSSSASSSGSSGSGSSSSSGSGDTSGSAGTTGDTTGDGNAANPTGGTEADATGEGTNPEEGDVIDAVAPEVDGEQRDEFTPAGDGTFDLIDMSGAEGEAGASPTPAPVATSTDEDENQGAGGGFSSTFELIVIIATIAISGTCAVVFGRKFIRLRKHGR